MDEVDLNLSMKNETLVAAWFRQYANSFLKYGLQITEDRELVKDVIQELFISVWNNADSEIKSVKHYLFIAFRRKLFKALKDQQRRRDLHIRVDRAKEQVASPLEMGIQKEGLAYLHDSVKDMLARLPQRQREIIFLRFYEELDYEDIAKIMELTYPSTRNLLFKALKNLRREAAHYQHLRQLALYTVTLIAYWQLP